MYLKIKPFIVQIFLTYIEKKIRSNRFISFCNWKCFTGFFVPAHIYQSNNSRTDTIMINNNQEKHTQRIRSRYCTGMLSCVSKCG